jgi:hypothetical protein
MSTLKQIRENNKKRLELETNKEYKYPKSISLVAKIMKEQNKMLINKICDLKKTTSSERKEILNEFLKINYYCPEITQYQKLEKAQEKYI